MNSTKENPQPIAVFAAPNIAPSAPTPISNGPLVQTTPRGHSTSLSLGSIGKTNRRKSVSGISAGALASISISQSGVPVSASRRPPRASFVGSGYAASVPTAGAIFPDTLSEEMAKTNSCAVADDTPLTTTGLASIPSGGVNKSRIRRASEGSRLIKRAKDVELRCEKCGKGYKHSSCLAKHLWEHTPEWALTSKLLISKHQQVQLLEAASVLVSMNQDMKKRVMVKSESSPDSPTQTGSSPGSEANDTAVSSTNTSPPPTGGISGLRYQQQQLQHQAKRQASLLPTAQSPGSSYPDNENSHNHRFHMSESAPGYTSFFNEYRHEVDRVVHPRDVMDESDLACAVGLLSCSYDNRHFQTPSDAPPVPPLPERFLQNGTSLVSIPGRDPLHSASYSPSQPISFQRGEPPLPVRPPVSPIDDGRFQMPKRLSTSPIMEEDPSMDSDQAGPDSRSEKWKFESVDDEGVFGRMED